MPKKKVTGPGSRGLGFAKPKAALDRARTVLSSARKSGDPARIAAAESAHAAAERQVAAAHLSRFEKVVAVRTVTVCRGLEEIIKLVNQRRYPVEERHSQAIQEAILEPFTALQTALAAAVDRGRHSTRRVLAFGSAVGSGGGGDGGTLEKTPLERAIAAAG